MMVFVDLICLGLNLVSLLVFFQHLPSTYFQVVFLLLELIFMPKVVYEQNLVSTKKIFGWLPSNPFFLLDTFLGFQPVTPQSFASSEVLMDVQKLIRVLSRQT